MAVDERTFFLQSDWFEVARPGTPDGGTFWIGCRQSNDTPSTHTSVRFDGATNTYQVVDQSSDIGVQRITGRRLTLHACSEPKQRTTFIAPFSQYDRIHGSAINSVDISEGNLAVSSGSDGSLIVWDAENGQIQRHLVGHALDVNCCRFFPSGLVVMSGGIDTRIKIWSVESGEDVRTMVGHKAAILGLCPINVGKNILSCSKDGSAKRWDCATGECLSTFSPELGSVNSLALSQQNEQLLALGTESGNFSLVDADLMQQVMTIKLEHAVNAVTFDRLGGNIYCGLENGSVVQINVNSRRIIRTMKTSRGAVLKMRVLVSKSGKEFLTSSFRDGTVTFRHMTDACGSNCCAFELSGADCDPVYDFAGNQQVLLTACRDKVIRKYQLSDLSD